MKDIGVENGMKQLKNMTYAEMRGFFESIGEKKFRADQVFRKLYQGADSFEQITELSKPLREKLESCAEIDSVQLLRKQESASDGTKKYLFGVRGGHAVESVFMKQIRQYCLHIIAGGMPHGMRVLRFGHKRP